MITAKRLPRPPYDSSGIKNMSSHFNQMTFKGIVQTENIFDVDPNSFRSAKNVYVNDDKTLVSRLPIIAESLPTSYIVDNGTTIETPIVSVGFALVDIFETGKVTVYVTKNVDKQYQIVVREKESGQLHILPELVNKYHISAIEKYVIVFNDVDTSVLDVKNYNLGWQPIRNLAYIPVTKRVVGQETFENPANIFTESYKEQYIWNKDIVNILPEGTADVSITQPINDIHYDLPDANLNTEFRLLTKLNAFISASDYITTATNTNTQITVIAIGRADHALISLDLGQSFDRIIYPAHKGFLNVASLSRDGLNYFFVAQDGVYRYSIDTKEWTLIRVGNLTEQLAIDINGIGNYNTSCFLNAEVFSFVLYREQNSLPFTRIYFKGPNLQAQGYPDNALTFVEFSNKSNPLVQTNITRQDAALFNMEIIVVNDIPTIVTWLPSVTDNSTFFIQLFGNRLTSYTYTQATWDAFAISPPAVNGNTALAEDTGIVRIYDTSGDAPVWRTLEPTISELVLDKAYGLITRITDVQIHPTTEFEMFGVELECVVDDGGVWKEARTIIGRWNNTNIDPDGWQDFYTSISGGLNLFTYDKSLGIPVTLTGAPLSLMTGYIHNFTTVSVDGIIDLPNKINDEEWPSISGRRSTTVNNQYFFMVVGDKIYSNAIHDEQIVTITYTRSSDTPYTQVPDLSHVNNELYLVFNNVLSITDNYKTGTDIEFNLPAINDHGFTSDVNGLINISTTEVAIFLVDEIFIVTKVPDETFAYRYDYLNTRLSVGIRRGDSVINTRDGMYTLYPTNQGLAIMNYQPDVATTDQVVEYVTENITRIWKDFYKLGPIKLLQMGDYIYLTNGTNNYLMLDLRGLTWWTFDSPISLNKLVTDQTTLYVVNNGLYKYDNDYKVYKDLYNNIIDWQIESQPMHFNAPSHYKNIRQLIFQFKQSSDTTQTIRSQIKLYRKQITLREPEIVNFQIDGYGVVVKRFNYWKINELQWGIASDPDTEAHARLQMNGITIKYEQGEEVR